ncbi:hypothetical protein D5086_011766 [Populus alba]|uniref:Uncharacterized protein n=1 Tax=Populus alba TaxID=43335 RepID=A0ACC4CDQ2_POPAL
MALKQLEWILAKGCASRRCHVCGQKYTRESKPPSWCGGDATESTVSAALNQKSSSIEGIEKWPYGAAAIAFEAMSRTLAQNCGVNILAKGEEAWIDMDRNNGKITDIVVSCPLYCSICSTGISVTLVKSNAPNGGQNVYWANG